MHTVPSCGVTVCGRRWDELPLRVTTILSTLRDAHFITAHVHTTDPGAELISSASRKIMLARRYRGSARWPALARPVMDEIEEGSDSVNQ